MTRIYQHSEPLSAPSAKGVIFGSCFQLRPTANGGIEHVGSTPNSCTDNSETRITGKDMKDMKDITMLTKKNEEKSKTET